MFVVVASQHDEIARAFAAQGGAHEIGVMTSFDLASAGWRHRLGATHEGTAVVGGRSVAVREIEGVLTRLAYVWESELTHIAAPDRAYVAGEMSAFLLAWLTALRCPVLNRPAPASLTGPSWRLPKWMQLAARTGLTVRPYAQHYPAPGDEPGTDAAGEAHCSTTMLTVVGEQCFGAGVAELKTQARALARAAGVALLTVYFDGTDADAAFLGVNTCPDISVPEVGAAVLAHLAGGDTC
jgi:hypothetical protein